MSTEFARILAAQNRGRTANIRHLLNKINMNASWTKWILTSTNSANGNATSNAKCNRYEKPVAGFILATNGLILRISIANLVALVRKIRYSDSLNEPERTIHDGQSVTAP